MTDFNVVKRIDITQEVCPMTFVKTKLALEQLETGQFLEVILKSGDSMRNVPRSIKEEGHKIVKSERDGENFRLVIQKL